MTDRKRTIGRLSRRDILALAGGGVAAAGATGLPAWAQQTAKKGGILKVAAPANPSSLDPATGGSGADHSLLWTMYDTLVEWDYETLKPKPGLAKWSYPDPKTMVLDIEKDVKFHDGIDLDAEAVKFNIERNRQDERSNIKADLTSVASVDVTGPLQVTLHLKNPDTALPAILSDRAGMMASPANLKALGADTNRKPVGAGPWKFVSWADNESVVVTRNAGYWRPGRPYLDGIEFAIIPESATALRSVTAGEKDMAFSLPARLKPIIDRLQAAAQRRRPDAVLRAALFQLRPRPARQRQGPPGHQFRARPRRLCQGDDGRARGSRDHDAAEFALGLRQIGLDALSARSRQGPQAAGGGRLQGRR